MSYSEKYTAKTWQNQASDGTIADDAPKMNASNIQTMDDGIEGAYKGLDEVKEYVDSRIDNHIYFGTYEGNGEASQFIELGFTPKAVYVEYSGFTTTHNAQGNTEYYGGLALQNAPLISNYRSCTVLSIETNGFRVYYDNTNKIHSNTNWSTNNIRHYIAFK